MKITLLFLFAAAVSWAEDSTPTNEQNFLPYALSECSDKEKPFFEQLSRDKGPKELLESLKVVLSLSKLRKEGCVIPEPILTFQRANEYRERLVWEGRSGPANHLGRLLIFACPSSVSLPAEFQSVTIIYTTDDYEVISWRIAGHGAEFQGASVRPEGDGGRLTLSFFQIRPSRELKIDFEVGRYGLYHDYPTADPADTGVPGWIEPTGPRITKVDGEALARKIVSGMSRAEVEEILKPYGAIPYRGGSQGGAQVIEYIFNQDREIDIWFTLARDGAEPIRDVLRQKPNDIVAKMHEPLIITRPPLPPTDKELERWRADIKMAQRPIQAP